MSSSQRDRSPAKKRRISPVRNDVGEEEVLETPRPAHRQLYNHNVPTLSPHSQSSLSVASSTRSRSPEKNITDPLLAPSPILSKQFEEYEAMPPKLETMVRKMRRISRGLEVVPDVCKPDITSRSEKAFRDIDASCYDPASKHPTPYPSAHTIAKIVRLARVCSNAGHYEADWNCRIHSYILDLALDNEEYWDELGFLNCTSAKIEPRSLLPTTFFGQPTGGKIVDFVVHLKSDSEMLQKMRDLASIDINNSPFSINHTRHSPLRFQPIAINIETKTTGTAWDEAMVQSSIWVASQFNRLTQLVKMVGGNGDEIPEIPLIIIQGHNWNFLAARRDQAGHTYIYRSIMFGTTDNPLGVYQVFAGLYLLLEWVRDVFRPWFRTKVLDLGNN